MIEADTMTTSAELHFTPLPVPAYPLTATNTLSNPAESRTLLHFQLEVMAGESWLEHFAKPVRLVLDVRGLTADLNPVYAGNFFLAYQDEANPDIWLDVPITIHQESGLISAEVRHFSNWAAGVRPERWNPSWLPPAVSEFSGAATYSYPIAVPPGRNGLQPTVSLSYSSRALDGRIRDSESGPIADGWSLGDISVVRVGVKLEDLWGTPWTLHPDKFRLVFNGSGHELRPIGSTSQDIVRYLVKDAPGYFLERHFNADAPNLAGFYWHLITPDGTRYRLGYTADAEEYQQVSHWSHLQVEGHAGINNYTSGIAWHVDAVTDSFGNQMTYHYHTNTTTENIEWWNSPYWTTFGLTTRSVRINDIK